jgi:hypothetical protein
MPVTRHGRQQRKSGGVATKPEQPPTPGLRPLPVIKTYVGKDKPDCGMSAKAKWRRWAILTFGIPIVAVTIENQRHLHRGRYHKTVVCFFLQACPCVATPPFTSQPSRRQAPPRRPGRRRPSPRPDTTKCCGVWRPCRRDIRACRRGVPACRTWLCRWS